MVMGLGCFQELPTPVLFSHPMARVITGLRWCRETQGLHQELDLGWALTSKFL